MSIRRQIARHLINYPGWRSHRKIVVIESDDWGTVRMPSKGIFSKLVKMGLSVDKCLYSSFDTLEDKTDLSMLFEVLTSVRCGNGLYPVITANTIAANPDFQRIKESNYNTYFFEQFTDTLKRDKRTEDAFGTMKEGIEAGIFHPQFHGREHVNVDRWMKDLRNGLPETRLAFDHGFFGLSPTIAPVLRNSYMAAMDYDSLEDQFSKHAIVSSGLDLFQQLFGFPSQSFIAPNYRWGNEINSTIAQKGVKFFQGMKEQGQPQIGGPIKYIRRKLGESNENGQTYLIRNGVFEPTLFPGVDAVSTCLKDISNAFAWQKPAIISIHRVNFMGGLDIFNRDKSLRLFKKLLQSIISHWPNVEFMTSDQLGNFISQKHKILKS